MLKSIDYMLYATEEYYKPDKNKSDLDNFSTGSDQISDLLGPGTRLEGLAVELGILGGHLPGMKLLAKARPELVWFYFAGNLVELGFTKDLNELKGKLPKVLYFNIPGFGFATLLVFGTLGVITLPFIVPLAACGVIGCYGIKWIDDFSKAYKELDVARKDLKTVKYDHFTNLAVTAKQLKTLLKSFDSDDDKIDVGTISKTLDNIENITNVVKVFARLDGAIKPEQTNYLHFDTIVEEQEHLLNKLDENYNNFLTASKKIAIKEKQNTLTKCYKNIIKKINPKPYLTNEEERLLDQIAESQHALSDTANKIGWNRIAQVYKNIVTSDEDKKPSYYKRKYLDKIIAQTLFSGDLATYKRILNSNELTNLQVLLKYAQYMLDGETFNYLRGRIDFLTMSDEEKNALLEIRLNVTKIKPKSIIDITVNRDFNNKIEKVLFTDDSLLNDSSYLNQTNQLDAQIKVAKNYVNGVRKSLDRCDDLSVTKKYLTKADSSQKRVAEANSKVNQQLILGIFLTLTASGFACALVGALVVNPITAPLSYAFLATASLVLMGLIVLPAIVNKAVEIKHKCDAENEQKERARENFEKISKNPNGFFAKPKSEQKEPLVQSNEMVPEISTSTKDATAKKLSVQPKVVPITSVFSTVDTKADNKNKEKDPLQFLFDEPELNDNKNYLHFSSPKK